MKKAKILFVLAAGAMLLGSCGNQGASSSMGNSEESIVSSSVSSDVSSETSSNPLKPWGSTSIESSSKKDDTIPEISYSIEETSSDDTPVSYGITLHADAKNEGLSVTCPVSEALPGTKITLEVTLSDGYILEYIRLYGKTTAEGGVRVKPDSEGNYSFVMPEKAVDIYYAGVKGYTVSFTGEHATVELAPDSADYDLFGEGYPVYVRKATVETGYYFAGFEVKDEQGNTIPTSDDRVDQVCFFMPKGNVTVKALAYEIDTAIATIAGTYSGGVQIDMNQLDTYNYKLTIGLDMKVTFVSDWVNTDWVGTYTYSNNVLEATVTNLSQDGYFTDTSRHLKVTFLDGGKYLATEFSSTTSCYHYLFGKPGEVLQAKKLYMSDFLSAGDYTKAHRIVSFTSMSNDKFFTYVNPTRTEAQYLLTANEKGSTTKVGVFTAGKTYELRTMGGDVFLEVTYDGSKITVSEPTGNNPDSSEGGQTSSLAFFGKTYANSNITLLEDDGYSGGKYTFSITFGSTLGSVTRVALEADPNLWSLPVQNQVLNSGVSYTYDADMMKLTVSGLGKSTILTYVPSNDSFIYTGTVWRTDWAAYATNNKNVILTAVEK